MPSIRYYNQSAPFWDWIASMEDQPNRGSAPFNPWGQWGETDNDTPMNDGEHPRRPGRGGDRRRRHSHGPPPHPHGPPGDAPPPFDGEAPPPFDGENPPDPPEKAPEDDEPGEGPSRPRGPPHHHHPHGHHGGWGGRGGRGGCGGRGRGGFSPFGGWGGREGPRGRHPFGGPWGGRGGFPFDLRPMAEAFQQQFFGGNNGPAAASGAERDVATRDEDGADFKPPVDVFDTESAFHVHVSLPGAQKDDVGVNWDAEKSELSIAGVVYRPGDEDFLKTLALDERSIGAFKREVYLGSRAHPAQVDADNITAKMEDGVLRIEVPKLDKDYVEIKKVDIE